MPGKTLNVALIGYKFMGKAHSQAWRSVGRFFDLPADPVMKVVCGRDAAAVGDFAKRWGWESSSSDWRDAVSRKDVDVVDISTPGYTHCDIAIAAAEAGKHVWCEKPLTFTLAEARKMLAAVKKAGVKHAVNFNYRRCPAVALAKRMIDDGAIGQIRHARFTYLQDWLIDPKFPMNWRLRKDAAGSGAHGDLGAHSIDLARFLVGDIGEVVGMKKTFIAERPAEGTSSGLSATAGEGTENVTVDDASPRHVRGHAHGAGTQELQPVRDQRRQGDARMVLRRSQLPRLLLDRRRRGPARLPSHHRHRRRAPLRRRLVAAGPHAGLRSRLHQRGG
jgi:predicted dehydrogenase